MDLESVKDIVINHDVLELCSPIIHSQFLLRRSVFVFPRPLDCLWGTERDCSQSYFVRIWDTCQYHYYFHGLAAFVAHSRKCFARMHDFVWSTTQGVCQWVRFKSKQSEVVFPLTWQCKLKLFLKNSCGARVKLVLCHIACVTRDQPMITWASRYGTVVKPLE